MPSKHKHQCVGCGKKYVSKPMKGCGQCGGGIFSSIGNFFKKTIPNAARTVYNHGIKPAANAVYKHAILPANQYLKDNKVVSNFIGSKIPVVGGLVSKAINDKTGYGKKRRSAPRKQAGGGHGGAKASVSKTGIMPASSAYVA